MSELKSILLAEDSPLDAEMTVTALREHSLANTIVAVSDGEQALDYLYRRGPFAGREPGNPVLILLDLKMPRVDGIEVTRQVKQDPLLRSIPVVMLTSSREENDLVRSYKMGINAYVVKPVDFPTFVDAVRQLSVFWTVHNELPLGVRRAGVAAPGGDGPTGAPQ